MIQGSAKLAGKSSDVGFVLRLPCDLLHVSDVSISAAAMPTMALVRAKIEVRAKDFISKVVTK